MLAKPTTIGRYRILGELGRGAMGVVYWAEDPRLKRNVAIKVVRDAGSAQREILERFQREAELSARLAHPNLITIFDVGEAPGIGPYLAMEWIDGETLAREVARGPLRPERAMLVLVQAYHALVAVHEGGVIHRDIKPDNFMVSKTGLVKLMDFGIARGHGSEGLTTSVFCTPAYAAPEVLDNQPPSPATDRWAFAVTAFQCLTGQLPFQAASVSAVLYQIAHEPPQFPPDTPTALRSVFLRAFQKQPEERHPDLHSFMAELLEALPLEPEVRDRGRALLEQPEAPNLAGTVALALKGTLQGRPRRIRWPLGVGAAFLTVVLGWGFGTGRFLPRRLAVTTEPSGAEVWVDGKRLGTTPLESRRIPRGATRVLVKKDGYLSVERALGAQDRRVHVDLVPQTMTLRIETLPGGAEVFLDGVLRGLTPIEALHVPAEGVHRLLIRKPGFEPWTGIVGKGQTIPETIVLKRHAKPMPPAEPEVGFWGRLRRKLWGKSTTKP